IGGDREGPSHSGPRPPIDNCGVALLNRCCDGRVIRESQEGLTGRLRRPGPAKGVIMSATRARRGAVRDEATGCRLALAVGDGGWFNVDNLFREVEHGDVATLMLECMDFGNAWSRGLPPWSWGRRLSQSRPGLWRREMVLPSGWMKRYPGVGMRPIGRAI